MRILLGVQISLVRFFVFKNVFISKQNEWTDQLKYCPSLPTFSHLSGNFRIPSRKNNSSLKAIQFWSQFSISTKEVNLWLAASFGTTSNQLEGAMSRKYGGWDKTFERFQIFVYDFSDMRPSIVMKKNNAKNLFSVVFESAVRKWKIAFQRLPVLVHKAPNFLVFESYGSQSYRNDLLSSPMILQAPLAFDSDLLRVMPLILCLNFFVQSEACLQRWNLHPWNVETIPYMIYQLEQYHYKLRQAFDGLQPHFSSN